MTTIDTSYLTARQKAADIVPRRLPGRRILLAFFNDYFVDSTSPLTTDSTYEYNFSMDPIYVFSTGYVESRFREWVDEKKEDLPSVASLAYGYYDSEAGINSGIGNFFKMIATAIDSAKRAGGSVDMWISIPGSYCSNNTTSGHVLFGSPWEVLREHMRSVEPDFVVIVNRDMNYLSGYDIWNSSHESYNSWTKSGSDIYSSSTDYWPQVERLCQQTGSQLIIPAMVHGDIKHRSHYSPAKGDMANVLDWNVFHTPKPAISPSYLINKVTPTIDGGEGIMPHENSRSMLSQVVYGDLYTGVTDEEIEGKYQYINCAPAVAGLMSSIGFIWGYRPVVNKSLKHTNVYYDMTEEQIDALTRFDINIMPIRRTIRNGICLAGNHTFKVIYTQPDTDVLPLESTSHDSFPVTRMHNVILANAVRREAQILCDELIGKSKPYVLGAIGSILNNVMNTKPVVSWDYNLIDHDIDYIEAIISIRVINTISDITTTVRINNKDQ